MSKEPIWVPLKDLLHVLKEYDMWSLDPKYLHIYLDTRYIDGDWHCTIKDREGKEYVSLEDIKERRRVFNS